MDAAPSVPPRPRGRTYACVSSITPIPGTFVKPEAQVGQRERKWLQLAVDASDLIGSILAEVDFLVSNNHNNQLPPVAVPVSYRSAEPRRVD